MIAYWYCPVCQEEVDSSRVTYSGQHYVLENRYIIDDNGKPSSEYTIHELLALLTEAEDYLNKLDKRGKTKKTCLTNIIVTQIKRIERLAEIIKEREDEF